MNTTCPQCRAFPGACLDHQPRLGRITIAPSTCAPPSPDCVQTFVLPGTDQRAFYDGPLVLGPDYKAMWEAAQAELEILRRKLAAQQREAA
jgi:hypothetical protein